jgi:hypothetical protein
VLLEIKGKIILEIDNYFIYYVFDNGNCCQWFEKKTPRWSVRWFQVLIHFSGHTATAFMGAEMLYQEYKDTSIWYGIQVIS